MKKQLSTSMTYFFKYIFSGFWMFGLGINTIFFMFTFEALMLPFIIVQLIASIPIYYGLMRAKKVHIDDDFLYVSDFRKEVKIPLENIKNVSENVLFSPRPIFIEFTHETEFGKKIMFIGYLELFLFHSTHPIVKQLKKILKST